MKKLFNIILIVFVSLLLDSCQNQKTSGFNRNDVVGSWTELTLGVGEPVDLHEDGTGISEGFLRTHQLKWDVENDSLYINYYYENRFQKQEKYSIDSLNIEQHEGNTYSVLCLSRMERIYKGYSIGSLADRQRELEYMKRWLRTDDGRKWLADREEKGDKQYGKYSGEYANDWLWGEPGKVWLESEDGKAWQQTADGKEFMRTELRKYKWAKQIK